MELHHSPEPEAPEELTKLFLNESLAKLSRPAVLPRERGRRRRVTLQGSSRCRMSVPPNGIGRELPERMLPHLGFRETPRQRIGGTRLLRFLALLVHKGRAKQQELRAARYAPLPTHAVSRPTLSVAFGLSLTTLSAGLALSHCQSYRMTGFLSACRLDCSINPHLRACRARVHASAQWSPAGAACA